MIIQLTNRLPIIRKVVLTRPKMCISPQFWNSLFKLMRLLQQHCHYLFNSAESRIFKNEINLKFDYYGGTTKETT